MTNWTDRVKKRKFDGKTFVLYDSDTNESQLREAQQKLHEHGSLTRLI